MKISRNLLVAVCLLLSLSACEDDIYSKLYGKWQLRQIDTNGQVSQVDTVFYSFEHELFEYQIYLGSQNKYYSAYGYCTSAGDKQIIVEFDKDKFPSEFLPLTDWLSLSRSFSVEKLTHNRLVLKDDNKRYIFRKH